MTKAEYLRVLIMLYGVSGDWCPTREGDYRSNPVYIFFLLLKMAVILIIVATAGIFEYLLW